MNEKQDVDLCGFIKDLRALTLLGHTRENLILEPLAVQKINKRLYIIDNFDPPGLLLG